MVLDKRDVMIYVVKICIDVQSNPKKSKLLYLRKENFEYMPNICDILEELGINQQEGLI